MYCQGDDIGAMIVHDDQFRGVEHAYLEKGDSPGDTVYAQVNPDYFQMINVGGQGLKPVGYGFRSIEYIIVRASQVIHATAGMDEKQALSARQPRRPDPHRKHRERLLTPLTDPAKPGHGGAATRQRGLAARRAEGYIRLGS